MDRLSNLPTEILAKIAIDSFSIKEITNDYDLYIVLSTMKYLFPEFHSDLIAIINPHIPKETLKILNTKTFRELKDIATKYNVCLDTKKNNIKKINRMNLQDIIRKHNTRDKDTGLTQHVIDEIKKVNEIINDRKTLFKNYSKYTKPNMQNWNVENWEVELFESINRFAYTFNEGNNDTLNESFSDDELFSDDEFSDDLSLDDEYEIERYLKSSRDSQNIQDIQDIQNIKIDQIFKKNEMCHLNRYISLVQTSLKLRSI